MTLANEILTPLYQKLQRIFPLREIRTRKELETASNILKKRFRDSYDDAGEEAYIFALSSVVADYEEKLEEREPEASGLSVLKHLIEENDMKQAALGEVLGVGQSAVSQILSGAKPITAEHARRLGKQFHVDPGAFI